MGVAFRPHSPSGNLCQKNKYLFIQCALSSISAFKDGRGPRRPFKLGLTCLQSHWAAARVFLRAFQTSGLKMPQHAATAHKASDVLYSSPTRLRERGFMLGIFFFVCFFSSQWEIAGRPGVPHRLQPASFLLSLWDCKHGRGTTLFSLMFGEGGGVYIYNKRRTASET